MKCSLLYFQKVLQFLQEFVYGGVCNEALPVVSSIQQGSMLDPFLFAIFINRLDSNLACDYIMLVDDIKL